MQGRRSATTALQNDAGGTASPCLVPFDGHREAYGLTVKVAPVSKAGREVLRVSN